MERKTKRFYLRLTESELESIRERAKPFGSMSNYIMESLEEFSDFTSREKLNLRKSLAELYISLDAKFAHIGGNLNQAMKRINENAQAGLPYGNLLKNDLYPIIDNCRNEYSILRNLLKDITHKLK